MAEARSRKRRSGFHRCGRGYSSCFPAVGFCRDGLRSHRLQRRQGHSRPQCAGLLIGRDELIANALLNNSPHEDTIGRSQKVGKEEIVGMIKALELFLAEDHESLNREWQRRLEFIASQVRKIPSVTTSFPPLQIANHVPHLAIKWDPGKIPVTPHDVVKAL